MIQLYKNVLEDDLVKELLDYYQHNLDRLTDYGNFEQVEIDAGHRLSNLMKDLTHKIGDDYFERHDKTSRTPKTFMQLKVLELKDMNLIKVVFLGM